MTRSITPFEILRLGFEDLGIWYLLMGVRTHEFDIDMVNVVLDIKCIRLKYMLETINYNKVHPIM